MSYVQKPCTCATGGMIPVFLCRNIAYTSKVLSEKAKVSKLDTAWNFISYGSHPCNYLVTTVRWHWVLV